MKFIAEKENNGCYSIYDTKNNFVCSIIRDDLHKNWKTTLVQPGYEKLRNKEFGTYTMARDYMMSI